MNLIRKVRKDANMTMKELANKLGVAESTISQYETGKREPDFDTLCRIADYFGVSVDYLLGRTDEKKSPSDVSEEDIMVALFDGDKDVSDKMWDEVKAFADFVKEREKQKAKDKKD